MFEEDKVNLNAFGLPFNNKEIALQLSIEYQKTKGYPVAAGEVIHTAKIFEKYLNGENAGE